MKNPWQTAETPNTASFKAYASLLSGYIGWGLFPLYWQLLVHVSPLEVTMHRIIWSVPVLALLIHFSVSRHASFKETFKQTAQLKKLALTAILISINWGVYIWAVANHRVLEASMGYFLSPILSIAAGFIIFKEPLTLLKGLAVLLACMGVSFYFFTLSYLPWAGLSVAFSFSAYGVLRKKIKTGAVVGLYIETIMLAPFALAALLVLHFQHSAQFLNSPDLTDFWLILGGLVTVVPLALFTIGTRLISMTSVGILFFITPSMQFLIGIFVLGEPMNQTKLIAFAIIWLALILYSISLFQHSPNKKRN